MVNDVSAEEKAEQEELWPGFTVQCDKCGSFKVTLENSLGYSPESGGWGSLDFQCLFCGNETELMEA